MNQHIKILQRAIRDKKVKNINVILSSSDRNYVLIEHNKEKIYRKPQEDFNLIDFVNVLKIQTYVFQNKSRKSVFQNKRSLNDIKIREELIESLHPICVELTSR